MIDFKGFQGMGGGAIRPFASKQQDAGSRTGLLRSRENVVLRQAQIKELA
jgi:hypothetical protein